jgi:hypothetical protein
MAPMASAPWLVPSVADAADRGVGAYVRDVGSDACLLVTAVALGFAGDARSRRRARSKEF